MAEEALKGQRQYDRHEGHEREGEREEEGQGEGLATAFASAPFLSRPLLGLPGLPRTRQALPPWGLGPQA